MAKKKSNRNYVSFIRKIVKQANEELTCGKTTLQEMHDIVNFVLNEFSETANDVTKLYAKAARSTAKPKLMVTALKLCLRGELRDRACDTGVEKLAAFKVAKGRNPRE